MLGKNCAGARMAVAVCWTSTPELAFALEFTLMLPPATPRSVAECGPCRQGGHGFVHEWLCLRVPSSAVRPRTPPLRCWVRAIVARRATRSLLRGEHVITLTAHRADGLRQSREVLVEQVRHSRRGASGCGWRAHMLVFPGSTILSAQRVTQATRYAQEWGSGEGIYRQDYRGFSAAACCPVGARARSSSSSPDGDRTLLR